jgi:NADH:ubiquinone oxidoreductase subunit 6 (subunit J)
MSEDSPIAVVCWTAIVIFLGVGFRRSLHPSWSLASVILLGLLFFSGIAWVSMVVAWRIGSRRRKIDAAHKRRTTTS